MVSQLTPLGLEAQGNPREDNIHILQLKWLSGKMKNLATFQPYACFQRNQSLVCSGRKICALQAGISG
jgi:hypothetical protein